LLLAVALGTAFPHTAAADVIISGDGTYNSSLAPDAANAEPATKSSYVAASFTITPGATYTFSDAIAYGIGLGGPPAGGATTYSTGSLWMGDSGSPATLVENLTTSINTTTYTFTATSPITLTGGDTFWLVITPTKQQLLWFMTDATPTGPGATYFEAGQGTLTGSASSPSVASYGNGPGGVADFEIDGIPAGSSTPEPSSLALLGSVTGIAAFGSWWKRRRQTKAVPLT